MNEREAGGSIVRIIIKSESSFYETFPLKDEIGNEREPAGSIMRIIIKSGSSFRGLCKGRNRNVREAGGSIMRIIIKSESSFHDTFPLKDEMGTRMSQVVPLCEL